jgi:hypothetical protein
MYIHIGSNILVSGNKCVGIFNVETLKLSDDNKWMLNNISNNDKTISLDIKNTIIASEVSSYTIIKRTTIKKDELLWSKKE